MDAFQTIRRGQTFRWVVGPRQAGETVRSVLREAAGGRVRPGAPEAAVATATNGTAPPPAGGADVDVWTMTLTAAQTAALTASSYILDERITAASGDVQVTDQSLVLVVEPATEAAA
jgi:hypothetical protein